jgi:hypothetical protein
MNEKIYGIPSREALQASTTLEKLSLAYLFGSFMFVAFVFGSIVADNNAGPMRFVVGLSLLFIYKLNVYLGKILYMRFLKTCFHKFYDAARQIGKESAFMSVIAPVGGEMLYEETLPRVGFNGLMHARDQVNGR